MGRLYPGIDQGTILTTALLTDEKWQVAGRGHKEHRQIFPRPGWVEHDPLEIYDSCVEAVQAAFVNAGAQAKNICCTGLDHQGETCLF